MKASAVWGGIFAICILSGCAVGEPAAGKSGGGSDSAPRQGEVQVVALGGGVMMEMVYLKGGRFQMGSPESESGRNEDESPVRKVELDGFWIGKHEVTQEQYEAITGTNPSHFQGPKNPVERVSWEDAMAFCVKLSAQTGQNFRLPTEAEWEYACRAGSQARFCFGDSDSALGRYAWYGANAEKQPRPAGGKEPNAWGLHDMHGNVWEWCADWYDAYPAESVKNPAGPSSGTKRVIRGGAWYADPHLCRSASRRGFEPATSSMYRGFRVVCAGPSSR